MSPLLDSEVTDYVPFQNILRLPKAKVVRLGHMRMLGMGMLVQRSAESAGLFMNMVVHGEYSSLTLGCSLEGAMSAVYARGCFSAPFFSPASFSCFSLFLLTTTIFCWERYPQLLVVWLYIFLKIWVPSSSEELFLLKKCTLGESLLHGDLCDFILC
jgi:hypothetical protein